MIPTGDDFDLKLNELSDLLLLKTGKKKTILKTRRKKSKKSASSKVPGASGTSGREGNVPKSDKLKKGDG